MEKAEPEIHAYIDDLCKNGFFGEATFYFQNGEIGNIRETARLGKDDVVGKYKGGKKARVIMVSQPKAQSAGGSKW
jgi:hypothetical protein